MKSPIGPIVRTDILFRFRRTSAVVTLLIVAAAVYFIVPDLTTGRTLMQIDGRRVIYNSAAVALGTAMFCTLFLSLLGYYLISNSFRRDIVARTGFIIAATPVSNAEYIIGKFLGNMLYLFAVMLTCMASAMVMFLIRGEGRLEPFVFLGIYVWITLPSMLFGAAAALAFEGLPVLSGRVGDVVYFFLWAAVLGLPASLMESSTGPGWLRIFDIVGFVPMFDVLQNQFHTKTMSIGASTFDVSLPPILFPGIPWSWELIGGRCANFFMPALLLTGARFWFHRYNPTRIKSSAHHAKRNLLSRVNAMLKPVTRFTQRTILVGGSRTSFMSAVRADVFTTFALSPMTAIAIVVFAIISLLIDVSSLREGMIPAMVVALVIALADIATRDQSAGMMKLLYTAPRLKARYVGWKFGSALVVALCFTALPIVRLFAESPRPALSLFIGSCLLAAGAIAMGVLVRSQKLFIAFFLMLLYIGLNAANTPIFDFAGFQACATPGVQTGYALMAALLLIAAHFRQKFVLKKS